ncbi:hypothetical protein [Dictyobacter alpinus]|uniref:hypothetical protein n=1 Tax=Dictyobacter alpinus TaxID=2014873 RepID=UPI000F839B35|nr:hypothetical protein [Dictyobacter alpinus]
MKIYESIVKESLLSDFPDKGSPTLANYATNFVGLPATLAVASVFWPRIVEVGDLIFLAEQYQPSKDEIGLERYEQKRTQEERRSLERVMNASSLGQMFYAEKLEILENEQLLDAFGETLKFFWALRLKNLFPDKDFVVEIGDNIGGEEGRVITFYQR